MLAQRLLLVVVLASLVAAAVVVLVWLGQRRLIYLPMGAAVPPVSEALPGAVDVRFATDDGLELRGWFLGRRPGSPGALVLPGNAGHRGMRVGLARTLHDLGMSVLLFDYRGYGGHAGDPSESGLLADARAAREALLTRLDGAPLVVVGESLGAGVAVALAADEAPDALVLRSPFTSLADVGRLHYPWLPVRALLSDRYPSLERIERIRAPLLVVAGDEDTIVPHAQSLALWRAAASSPKRLVTIEGAGHNDPALTTGAAWTEELERFLVEAGVLRESASPETREVG